MFLILFITIFWKKGGETMTVRERFNAAFKREPTEKEIEILKRVDDTWYGEHMDWNSSLL